MKWRIYYGDGSTFSNKEGSPQQAPPWNIQDIIQEDPEKGLYHQHGDYYVYRKSGWFSVDFTGLIDFLAHEGGPVKFGRTIDTKRFLEIRARADKDPDFKPRGG